MKLVTVLSVLAGSLIVAGPIRAETIYFRLAPDKKSGDQLTIKVERVTQKGAGGFLLFHDKIGNRFTIKVERVKKKDAGDFLVFHVTAKQKDVGVGDRRSGRLEVFKSKEELFKDKESVSSAEVKPTKRDGELSFSFRVPARQAGISKFTYAETEGASFEGHFFWFYLEDFVQSK